jgi:hypothetical protein
VLLARVLTYPAAVLLSSNTASSPLQQTGEEPVALHTRKALRIRSVEQASAGLWGRSCRCNGMPGVQQCEQQCSGQTLYIAALLGLASYHSVVLWPCSGLIQTIQIIETPASDNSSAGMLQRWLCRVGKATAARECLTQSSAPVHAPSSHPSRNKVAISSCTISTAQIGTSQSGVKGETSREC